MSRRLDDWLLYFVIGLCALKVVASVVVETMPADLRAFLDDPKAVNFSRSEVHGRACRDMRDEAADRGATRWACWPY